MLATKSPFMTAYMNLIVRSKTRRSSKERWNWKSSVLKLLKLKVEVQKRGKISIKYFMRMLREEERNRNEQRNNLIEYVTFQQISLSIMKRVRNM
jgi:hypothetical protein